MKHVFITLLISSFILFSTILGCAEQKNSDASKKIDLKVLYVGHPDSDREKDFVSFLKQYFKDVKTGDLKEFKEEQTKGYDVIILDYDGEIFKSPRPKMSRTYNRPTVTVGVPGALICGSNSLKTGYL